MCERNEKDELNLNKIVGWLQIHWRKEFKKFQVKRIRISLWSDNEPNTEHD